MEPRKTKHLGRKTLQLWPFLVGILLVAGVGYLLASSVLGEKWRNASYDSLFVLRRIPLPSADVVMVVLDEESHEALKQPYDKPWDRRLHSQLLDRLTMDGARAVVFDIVFSDPLDAEVDKQFANSIAANKRTVLAVEERNDFSQGFPQKVMEPPLALFKNSAGDHFGLDIIYPEGDFEIRRYALDNGTFPSEALAAAQIAHPESVHSLIAGTNIYLNYLGPSGSIPAISFHNALDQTPGFYKDKVVFIGARFKTRFSGERKDEYPTPFTRTDGSLTFGVEVHATAYVNITSGNSLGRLSSSTEELIIVVLGVLIAIGFLLMRPWFTLASAILLSTAIFGIQYRLFSHSHLWFPWLIIVAAQVPLAMLWAITIQSFRLYVDKRLYEQTLSLYLSPKLVKKFASSPELLKPGAHKQTLTIFFSDIANFTSFSEGMNSDDLALSMNIYFETHVSECIHKTDGTVVKYIGDAIFSFWNAPEPQPDHELRACLAALLFKKQKTSFINKYEVITRIGLHTGVANVGNFGSHQKVDYTAIGESINMASRMEGLNKHLGTQILITEDTWKGVNTRLHTRYLGKFQLKGFQRSVGVHELLDEVITPLNKFETCFKQAVEAYQQRNVEESLTLFKQCSVMKPEDGPTKFYISYFETLINLPGAPWTGDVILYDK
ncbi:MAG: hypothetical protein JWN25_3457 [Verrucomicrobiales bacterium]|nr:hypothetical protein [Verrucomicrobiales bacterium]